MTYRIYAFTRQQKQPHGYVGFEEVHVQELHKKTWFGWKVIDEEIVPSHVIISIGCLGVDPSNWRSKFTKFGSFGRDGVIQ